MDGFITEDTRNFLEHMLEAEIKDTYTEGGSVDRSGGEPVDYDTTGYVLMVPNPYEQDTPENLGIVNEWIAESLNNTLNTEAFGTFYGGETPHSVYHEEGFVTVLYRPTEEFEFEQVQGALDSVKSWASDVLELPVALPESSPEVYPAELTP